jgi:hypothetical protein
MARVPVRGALRKGRHKVMPQALLIIVCDEEVAPPDLATTLEVIAPMSPSRFLSKASRGHHGRRNRHQVGSFPGLQTGLCTRLSRQLRQLLHAPIESTGVPEPSRVPAHSLLHCGHH